MCRGLLALLVISVMGCGVKEEKVADEPKLPPLTKAQYTLLEDVTAASKMIVEAARYADGGEAKSAIPSLTAFFESLVVDSGLFNSYGEILPLEIEETKEDLAARLNFCATSLIDPTQGGRVLPWDGIKAFSVSGDSCPIYLLEKTSYSLHRSDADIVGTIDLDQSYKSMSNSFTAVVDVTQIQAAGRLKFLRRGTDWVIDGRSTSILTSASIGSIRQETELAFRRMQGDLQASLTIENHFPGYSAIGRVRFVNMDKAKVLQYTINSVEVTRSLFNRYFALAYDFTIPGSL